MERLAQSCRIFATAFLLCAATSSLAQAPGAAPAPSATEGGAGAAQVPGAVPAADAPPPVALRVAIPGNLFASLEKGVPTGIFLETVDALLKKSGVAPTYLNMPTGEAIQSLNAGAVAMATVVVPVPRIKDAAYFSDPIVIEHNIAVTLKDKGFDLGKVADLRGRRIGARTGYQYPLLQKDPGIVLQRFQTDGEMLRALLFGAVDVVIISAISDIYAFRSEGIMTRMEILKTSVGTVPLVAAFSKKQFTKESVDAFNRALEEFKNSPEWQDILERNGVADLVRDWPMVTE